MSGDVIAPRRAWLAGLLSVPFPGVGQLYAGQPAAAFFTSGVMSTSLLLAILAGSYWPRHLVVAVWVGLAIFLLTWFGQFVHAIVAAVRAGPGYRLQPYNRFLVYFIFTVVISQGANLVGSAVRGLIAEPFFVPAQNMEPTLKTGDHLYALKMGDFSRPVRGAIVVYVAPGFEGQPNQFRVGRLVGLPGETIEIVDAGVVVNGHPLPRSACPQPEYAYEVQYVADQPVRLRRGQCVLESGAIVYATLLNPEGEGDRFRSSPRMTLGETQYFVMGDNRDDSVDSREFGALPADHIVGRMAGVHFSYSPIRGIQFERFGFDPNKSL